jgi:hypothetical protein
MSKKKAKKQKEKFLRILTTKSLRLEWVAKSKNMDDNTLSKVLPNQSRDFLFSDEWRKLRLEALRRYGTNCAKCGRPDSPKYPINVDHIKPRKYFPHLALDIENLQPLCPPCNEEKGNKNKEDYRKNTGTDTR